MAEVWDGALVSDETLTMAISKLRKALCDDPRAPRIIETIPKGGYRLMVPVATAPEHGRRAPSGTATVGVPTSSARAPGPETPRTPNMLFVALGVSLLLLVGLALRPKRSSQLAPALLESDPLTNLPGREMHPALSPDGHYVVFAHQRDGIAHDLFLRTIDEERLVQLTEDQAIELRPVWSPGGREIAFARIADERCEIVRQAILGGQARRVADCGEAPRPDLAWSPDGGWLAFADRSDPEHGIGIVQLSLESGQRQRLTNPAETSIRDSRPVYSPAGDRLAFVRQQADGRSDLFTVAVEGGEARRVTQNAERLWGHAWTGDGRELVYSSLTGETFALWRVAADGGASRWLPIPGVSIARDPSLASRADGLVFEAWSYDANIRRVLTDAETDEPLTIAASTAWDSAPQLSPDGTMLSFVSSRSGRGALWVSGVDGSAPRRLVSGVRYIETTPRWSPGSDRLAFVTGEGQGSHIAVVAVASGETNSAGAQTIGGRAPAWSADGQELYFASTRDGSWQVWTTRLGSSEAEPVTRDGGFAAQASSDGRWLYYSRPRAPGLWRQPVQGGPAEKISNDPGTSSWGNWQVIGETVILARPEGSGTVVVRWEIETQKESVVAELPGRILNPGFAASPDGQALWFSRLDNSESDLRWVGGFR